MLYFTGLVCLLSWCVNFVDVYIVKVKFTSTTEERNGV